jgi:chemotaxis protein CheD
MLDSHLCLVATGEVKVGRRGEVLTALLGSCVAIGLIWRKGGRCALAHCLLPESPDATLRIGARYVNQAVPSLLALLGAGQEDYADVQVIVAGGANMLGAARLSRRVGNENAAAARRYLEQSGLHISHMDVGGRSGRTISINSADHTFSINTITRID